MSNIREFPADHDLHHVRAVAIRRIRDTAERFIGSIISRTQPNMSTRPEALRLLRLIAHGCTIEINIYTPDSSQSGVKMFIRQSYKEGE